MRPEPDEVAHHGQRDRYHGGSRGSPEAKTYWPMSGVSVAGRPEVGGFPYLAETLRRAGVKRNLWLLPACQSLYLTEHGPVVTIATPLVKGTVDVPAFDCGALIAALRTDQAGKNTLHEFLAASWQAGVTRYEVDFAARTVSYYGSNGEEYVEEYPGVDVSFPSR